MQSSRVFEHCSPILLDGEFCFSIFWIGTIAQKYNTSVATIATAARATRKITRFFTTLVCPDPVKRFHPHT